MIASSSAGPATVARTTSPATERGGTSPSTDPGEAKPAPGFPPGACAARPMPTTTPYNQSHDSPRVTPHTPPCPTQPPPAQQPTRWTSSPRPASNTAQKKDSSRDTCPPHPVSLCVCLDRQAGVDPASARAPPARGPAAAEGGAGVEGFQQPMSPTSRER